MKFLCITLVLVVLAGAQSQPQSHLPRRCCESSIPSMPSLELTEYRPVCGIDLSRPFYPVREFGSRCQMDVNNCQNKENYREVDISICRGPMGPRHQ